MRTISVLTLLGRVMSLPSLRLSRVCTLFMFLIRYFPSHKAVIAQKEFLKERIRMWMRVNLTNRRSLKNVQ